MQDTYYRIFLMALFVWFYDLNLQHKIHQSVFSSLVANTNTCIVLSTILMCCSALIQRDKMQSESVTLLAFLWTRLWQVHDNPVYRVAIICWFFYMLCYVCYNLLTIFDYKGPKVQSRSITKHNLNCFCWKIQNNGVHNYIDYNTIQ